MVANLQTAVPAQDILYRLEQAIVRQIDFTVPANSVIGTLPANAVVTGIVVATTTAFNATTTNTLDIGQTDPTASTPTAYAAAAAFGTVGMLVPTLGATAVPLPRPTSVTVRYNQTGTAATAGNATIVVRFVAVP
jgi:hypothetical protein